MPRIALVPGATALALALALGGCDFTAFSDLEDDAPTVALEAPDDYPSIGYGRVVAAYEAGTTTMPAATLWRIAVSAGPDTPVRIYTAWDGVRAAIDPPLLTECDDRPRDCGATGGAALSGTPAWRDWERCALVGAPDSDMVTARCETSGPLRDPIMGATGERFGAAIAGVPSGASSGRVALIGAPNAGGGSGAVYALRFDPVTRAPAGLEVAMPSGTVAIGLGSAIAVAPTATSGELLVAAAAPIVQQVVVGTWTIADGTFELKACLHGATTGWGASVAVGDVLGDLEPEVIVGSEADAAGRSETVSVFPGEGIPIAPAGCDDWLMPSVEVACPGDQKEVACASSGFGAALAVGDVDGDDKDDLVVGAPFANVSHNGQTGAVWVLAGSSGSSFAGARADVLTYSSPEPGMLIGTSVATFRTRGRDEIVAGAPGAATVFVFLCSALEGTSLVGSRCIPSM